MPKDVDLETHSILERISLNLGSGIPVDQLGSCFTVTTGMLPDCSQHTVREWAQQTPGA